mgnify:CR=1 FL=1
MLCPACCTDSLAPSLDPHTGLEVDSCHSCEGIWFDAKELARFLESASLKKTFGWDQKQRKGESNFTINTSARKCPRCSDDMQDRLFGGVTLDRCDTCGGLWFDGGELQTVVTRYRSGGQGDYEITKELRAGLGESSAQTSQDQKKSEMLASVRDFLASLGVPEEG